MRALVTGASGFAGGHLVRHLLDCGDTVLGTYIDAPLTLKSERFEQVKINLCEGDKCRSIVANFWPEVIYHLAGISFVPEAEENFDRVLDINVGATNALSRACHLLELRCKFLFISSAEVYGKFKPQDLPLTETLSPEPANNYSLTKLMAEYVVRRYAVGGFVTPIIVRPFNHIGPGQNNRFVASSFAEQLALIKVGKAPAVMRVGNLEAKRDFSDVRDIVRGYRLAATIGNGIYNLGSGRAVRVREILDTLIDLAGINVIIEQDPSRMRAAEVPEVYGSIERARRELRWEPQFQLRDTLGEIFKDCLQRVSG